MKIRIRKIPIDILLKALTQLVDEGFEFIDIEGEQGDKIDVFRVIVPEEGWNDDIPDTQVIDENELGDLDDLISYGDE